MIKYNDLDKQQLDSLCRSQKIEITKLNDRLNLILTAESLYMQKRQHPQAAYSGLKDALYDALNDKIIVSLNMEYQEKLKYILINKYNGTYNIRSELISFEEYSYKTLRFLKLSGFVFSKELEERFRQTQ
jgi:hypothetical protein